MGLNLNRWNRHKNFKKNLLPYFLVLLAPTQVPHLDTFVWLDLLNHMGLRARKSLVIAQFQIRSHELTRYNLFESNQSNIVNASHTSCLE